MGNSKIFFCRKCKTLDYAEGKCPKCGSAKLDEANIEFLAFGSNVVKSPKIPILLTRIDSIEKNGSF